MRVNCVQDWIPGEGAVTPVRTQLLQGSQQSRWKTMSVLLLSSPPVPGSGLDFLEAEGRGAVFRESPGTRSRVVREDGELGWNK